MSRTPTCRLEFCPGAKKEFRRSFADPKDPEFVTTPMLTAQESKIARFADLKLSADGVLEGDIREIWMGNRAAEWRERFASMNDAEREDDVRQELKARFAEFEMSSAKFSGTEDSSKAVGLRYHVKIDGYAQRSGKRMFVTLAFFEAALGARFTASTREQPIYFPYPWSENDVVTIQMPEGYALDHADAPAPLQFAPIGKYAVKIFVKQPNNTLEYHRELVFGSDKVLVFDTKAYPAIKEIFDRVHEADAHMLTLNRTPRRNDAKLPFGHRRDSVLRLLGLCRDLERGAVVGDRSGFENPAQLSRQSSRRRLARGTACQRRQFGPGDNQDQESDQNPDTRGATQRGSDRSLFARWQPSERLARMAGGSRRFRQDLREE